MGAPMGSRKGELLIKMINFKRKRIQPQREPQWEPQWRNFPSELPWWVPHKGSHWGFHWGSHNAPPLFKDTGRTRTGQQEIQAQGDDKERTNGQTSTSGGPRKDKKTDTKGRTTKRYLLCIYLSYIYTYIRVYIVGHSNPLSRIIYCIS